MKKWRLEPDMKCRSEKVSKHNDENIFELTICMYQLRKKTKTIESQIFSDDMSTVRGSKFNCMTK